MRMVFTWCWLSSLSISGRSRWEDASQRAMSCQLWMKQPNCAVRHYNSINTKCKYKRNTLEIQEKYIRNTMQIQDKDKTLNEATNCLCSPAFHCNLQQSREKKYTERRKCKYKTNTQETQDKYNLWMKLHTKCAIRHYNSANTREIHWKYMRNTLKIQDI